MGWKQFTYVLYQTTRASFLAQEKNSSLGLIWHFLNPLLMTAVLWGVFSQLDRLGDIKYYPLFILVGLTHYNFFISVTTRATSYFLQSRSLILNTTVPLELLVLRQTCVEGLTLFVEVLLVLVLGSLLGVDLTAWILVYPVVFLGLLILSLGASLAVTGLAVFLTDLNYIWALFCRILFFLTPIIFPREIAGDGLARTLFDLNPLTRLITIARDTLIYGNPVTLEDLGGALLGPVLVLLLGIIIFRFVRNRIADFI